MLREEEVDLFSIGQIISHVEDALFAKTPEEAEKISLKYRKRTKRQRPKKPEEEPTSPVPQGTNYHSTPPRVRYTTY